MHLMEYQRSVYYELLPENQTDVTKYCEQLDRLRETVQQKCPELEERDLPL